MVARGRGKKAAAAVAVAVPEAEAILSNGDVSQETDAVSEVAVAVAPSKKGRARGAKKEVKDEVDETPPIEVVEKPTKPAKAAKGSKRAPKGKTASTEAEEKEVIAPVEDTKKDILSEDDAPLVEAKPAIAEKKTHHRKRKNDSSEKSEDTVLVAKKAPKVTKTKGAKKETVDIDGIPEDPSAAVVSSTVLPETQTNGNKKSASKKRGAPKIEEPVTVAEEPIPEEPEQIPEEPVAKKASRSKSSKKEKETKKSGPKSKGSKKALKVAEEAEEEVAEHDVLPEDEFVPEIEEEEEEPKPKKIVKSKGSRKQLKDEVVIPPSVAEKIPEIVKEKSEEPTESEADSAIDEEQQTKPKGKKAPAAKKEKAPVKKAPSKKAAKTKKTTKEEEQPADEDDEILNDKEEHQDAAAVVETSKRKPNGNAKQTAEPVEKKTGRGRKRAATATPTDEPEEQDGSKNAKQDILLNPTKTDYNPSDFTLDKEFNLKISSWNIAGLRSWLKKDGLQYLQHEQPDILCLQEIKCTTDQLPEEARIPGYHPYWLCMPGGYAGVAVYSKIMPINVEYGIGNAEYDDAGRIITAEYEKFYLISVYVPNSGRKLVNLDKRMKWEELFREYIQKLEKVKPVIIAGDMNVSHKEIDLANPKTNTKNAGFTPQEREAMTKLLALGYVDTFRHLYPDKKGAYTFWSFMGKARSKNVGWRLDYFILSERITPKVVESTIRPQVLGSDHCPITLFLNI